MSFIVSLLCLFFVSLLPPLWLSMKLSYACISAYRARHNDTCDEDASLHHTKHLTTFFFSFPAKQSFDTTNMSAIETENSQQSLVRWKATLISVIDSHLQRHYDSSIHNAQAAVSGPPGWVELLLWKGDAMQYLPGYNSI